MEGRADQVWRFTVCLTQQKQKLAIQELEIKHPCGGSHDVAELAGTIVRRCGGAADAIDDLELGFEDANYMWLLLEQHGGVYDAVDPVLC